MSPTGFNDSFHLFSLLVRLAYIEENMKLRRGEAADQDAEDTSTDPYAELFEKSKRSKEKEEGSVTNSLAMLTAIPEVDLGMECVTFYSPCDTSDNLS